MPAEPVRIEVLREIWPSLVWEPSPFAGTHIGNTRGAAIVVRPDVVLVSLQGIQQPAVAHDGTIDGLRRALRGGLQPAYDLLSLLSPRA
jgi:hypothetical protein